MKSKPKADDFTIHNSIVLAVFLGAFVLWNCGGPGMFSIIRGASVPPIWEIKNPWEFFILEISALVSAGFQLFIFVVVCGATNAIGVRINKNQSK